MMTEYCIVLITVSTAEEANQLAEGLVLENLAACVNIIPAVQSVYWWEGSLQHDEELLLVCKTHQSKWDAIQAWVKAHHSYMLPEIIQITVDEGFLPYLQWIRARVKK